MIIKKKLKNKEIDNNEQNKSALFLDNLSFVIEYFQNPYFKFIKYIINIQEYRLYVIYF